ncbi:hypothetical protein M5D96_005625 [Drosophila gunungcola]|uniref:THAP-type domain-containing protein n=1 Tax=Drosophila gunungcola TaxID=103775 RepID=A0A9P9YQT8_9MUSC|nr:hypothetical protein M5D96_005625 [Drosophila gunungcola]
MRCAVNNCGNNNRNSNRKKWRYFHFPKEELLLQQWIDFCQRDRINTVTACICNEHFAPEDFERNMQFELGFTRKNPTKLKSGSIPSVNRPQKAAKEKRGRTKKRCTNDSSKNSNSVTEFYQEEPQFSNIQETIEIQLCDIANDFEELEESSSSVYNEIVELIGESGRSTSSQQSKDDDSLQDHRHLEVEILDPLNPQSNAKDHVEIIDSEGDNYVKHLEHEVAGKMSLILSCNIPYFAYLEEYKNQWSTGSRPALQVMSSDRQHPSGGARRIRLWIFARPEDQTTRPSN